MNTLKIMPTNGLDWLQMKVSFKIPRMFGQLMQPTEPRPSPFSIGLPSLQVPRTPPRVVCRCMSGFAKMATFQIFDLHMERLCKRSWETLKIFPNKLCAFSSLIQ